MSRRAVTSVLAVALLVPARASVAAEAAEPLAGPATSVGASPASEGASERPPYVARVRRIPRPIRAWMRGISWRPGCPVPIRKLRLVTLRYWGFDREAHRGRLVVHRNVARGVARIFGRLYATRFPIRRMHLVDRYGANDRASMTDDNTSAFNCRWRAGQPGVWSMHAYGRAIDVNPRENPYLSSGGFSPPNAGPYVDRSDRRRGMIFHGDRVWRAFRRRGWEWGGDWRSPDYQHFSTNGR